jgi:hypothetical protein
MVPRTNGRGVIAYSFGADNLYHHPRPETVALHVEGGWRRAFATPKGDVVFLPPGLRAADKLKTGLIFDWDPLPPHPGPSVWKRLRMNTKITYELEQDPSPPNEGKSVYEHILANVRTPYGEE